MSEDMSTEERDILERFERGIALSRFCHTRLDDAERRIEARIAERVPPGLRRGSCWVRRGSGSGMTVG